MRSLIQPSELLATPAEIAREAAAGTAKPLASNGWLSGPRTEPVTSPVRTPIRQNWPIGVEELPPKDHAVAPTTLRPATNTQRPTLFS